MKEDPPIRMKEGLMKDERIITNPDRERKHRVPPVVPI